MALKSNFKTDLEKEEKLSLLLDSYYKAKLKNYTFERVSDINKQYEGVDIIFKHKKTTVSYSIDEKAQLDYIGEDLPTFAFEIAYQKNGKKKEGWLFNPKKKTDFYSLITAIYADEPNSYTSCKITLVNRKKLIAFLLKKGISKASNLLHINTHGKHKIKALRDKDEGYFFYSKNNKYEQPINLILRIDYLIKHKIAKRLD